MLRALQNISAICFSCRINEHFQSEVNLSPTEKIKINFYFHVIDKLCVELKECFLPEINDFAFLDARHFNAIDAEARISRLASRYGQLDPANIVSQWRLSHQSVNSDASIKDIYEQLPPSYTDLAYTFCKKYC